MRSALTRRPPLPRRRPGAEEPASALCAIVVAALLLVFAATVRAESIRILVQSSPLAGFQYYAGSDLWAEMREGDQLVLVREPENAQDANAVRVEWRGHKLGYLPRAENRSVAAEMDRGTQVVARIAKLTVHRNPWRRLLIEVFVAI